MLIGWSGSTITCSGYGGHQHAPDPAALDLAHGDPALGVVDPVAGLREPAEPLHQEARHRLVGALGQLDAGLVLEVVEVQQAVDLDVAAAVHGGLGLVEVVLVLDVTDELLDEVLHRDDAGGAAVLVGDDREVHALAAHVGERGEDRAGPGQHQGLPGQLADPQRAVGHLGVEQVADVHEADHVVGGAADDRVARVRLVQRLLGGPEHRRRGVQEVDLGARDHHLADLPVTGLEDVLDDPSLLLAQGLVGVDEVAQLLVGHLLALGVRVAADQPDHDVGRDRQQPDDRTRDLGDPVDGRAERQREALGALQREPLGGQLAEHQGDVGDRDRDQHQRDDVGGAGRHAPVDQLRRQVAGERRATEGGGQEAGERDADLDRGQEAVGVRRQPRDGLAPTPSSRHRSHLAVAQRHQRDLGSREHAADEDEDDDKPDVRERAVHGL